MRELFRHRFSYFDAISLTTVSILATHTGNLMWTLLLIPLLVLSIMFELICGIDNV